MEQQAKGDKRISVGLLAHVDAGKTTLTEGLLYCAGTIKTLGRVDHQNAFLDTDSMERERGITIFTKQAVMQRPGVEITLLDTPGHVDFSGEMERTLQVLDYAVLVISGTDGVQSHTRTVWKLLERHGVPVILFVNKMDLPAADQGRVLAQLRSQLSEQCFPLLAPQQEWAEQLAVESEQAMEEYLEQGAISQETLKEMMARRQAFACLFGSALKLEGVKELLNTLETLTCCKAWPGEFGARVYKIGRDSQGARLTYLKITGGCLSVKELVQTGDQPDQREKVDQIRLYSAEKFQLLRQAPAGTVCAVTGLQNTWAGQGLGIEPSGAEAVLAPVQSCRLLLPQGSDVHQVLRQLAPLQEEEPQLHLVWNEQLGEICLQMMGEVQLDVLKQKIFQRFGLAVGFAPGNILYKETIAAPVEGVGHFEPLRHYAEVHLLLEPGPAGSGLQWESVCSQDELAGNWQRLILSHLAEKEHRGVLTASPLTDVKITLLCGRAHEKHTEGGDFRQATYRAVRQGLMKAESVLLEPWYEFRLELPVPSVGRAMADLQRMGAEFAPPEQSQDRAVLTGFAPVSEMRGYGLELTGYTRGEGQLSCIPAGYRPCHNTQQVLEQVGYDPERDVQDPADSVFCAHGAGYTVPWDQVDKAAHLPMDTWRKKPEPEPAPRAPMQRLPGSRPGSLEEDKELEALFARTYGAPKGPQLFRPVSQKPQEYQYQEAGPEYLLVDGYNLLFAWDELKEMAAASLEAARQALADILCNYQGFRRCQVILVFDAYKVKHGTGHVERYHNIHIVYTKEAETADMYIEKATYQLADRRRVRVVTSDAAEQLIILGHGALRISARAFREEVEHTNGQIRQLLNQHNR